MFNLPNTLRDKTDITFYGLLFTVLTILLLGNAFGTVDTAFHFTSFTLGVWGKYLCYAVLAISLNMLWGYTGLLCLGQCLFFALGGYAFGMYLILMIGVDPTYNTALPDFMDFMGSSELPSFWIPFHNSLFAFIAAIVVPGILGFIFGLLAFRLRIK
mgnify:FL=1